MQIDRETLEQVEAALAVASRATKTDHLGDKWRLPSAVLASAALARLRKAMEDHTND